MGSKNRNMKRPGVLAAYLTADRGTR
jgi:hypothetical protein